MEKRIGIYPGSFDPVTYGHIDLIERALCVFDEVLVAVAHQAGDKNTLFSVEERKQLLTQAVGHKSNIRIVDFDGLIVDFARKMGCKSMIRGLRMLSDFEYEFQMALTNRKLASDIETIFLMPSESYSYISSRHVKELARLNGNISSFAPAFVINALKEKVGT